MTGNQTCAVYVRMARCDSQPDMESQERDLMDLAEREGYAVSEVFRETGPGDAPNRPVFDSLVSAICEHRFDAVIARDLSRFARGNDSAQRRICDALRLTGTKVITIR
ncbi:MAG: recombinase family protein [Clostridia bacterium]|nr:recombinase family protein [Clostridia bacterium]